MEESKGHDGAVAAAGSSEAVDKALADLLGDLDGMGAFDPLAEETAAEEAARIRRSTGRERGAVTFTMSSEVDDRAGQVLDFKLCEVLNEFTAFHSHVAVAEDDTEAVGLATVRIRAVESKAQYAWLQAYLDSLLLREHRKPKYSLTLLRQEHDGGTPAALNWSQRAGAITWCTGSALVTANLRKISSVSSTPVPECTSAVASAKHSITILTDNGIVQLRTSPVVEPTTLIASPAGQRFTSYACAGDDLYITSVACTAGGSGCLWRVQGAASTASDGDSADLPPPELQCVDDSIAQPVCIAASSEGALLVTDPSTGTLWKYTLAADVAPAKQALATFPSSHGVPFTVTTDSRGHAWVGMLLSGGVINVDSFSGKVLGRVVLPTALPVSILFAGPILDDLLVSAASSISDAACAVAGQVAGKVLAASLTALVEAEASPISKRAAEAWMAHGTLVKIQLTDAPRGRRVVQPSLFG